MCSHGGNKGNMGMSHYNDAKRDMMKQDGHNQGHMQSGRGNRGHPQGGWVNRGNMRGRGGGRGRGNFRTIQVGNAGAKPKNTLKFDNDYDFEQANTEFEELR